MHFQYFFGSNVWYVAPQYSVGVVSEAVGNPGNTIDPKSIIQVQPTSGATNTQEEEPSSKKSRKSSKGTSTRPAKRKQGLDKTYPNV